MRWSVLATILTVLLLAAGGGWAEVLVDGQFRVEYPAGEERTAALTLQNLQKLTAAWRHRLDPGEAPIVVYICPTQGDFAAKSGFWPPEEVGGVAHSEDGVIVLRTPGQLSNPGHYEGVVRHELVHVLLARNTDLSHLPRWLNEGIAMHVAAEHRWNSSIHVARMYMSDRLYDYEEVMILFDAVKGERPFGDLYAQSLSMTSYLHERLGEDAFWELVYSLREKDFPDVLEEHAGMTPEEFWDAWHRSLWKVAVISAVMSGFGVFHLMALLLIVAYIRKRRRNRRVMDRWAEEEAEDETFVSAWRLEQDSEHPWERKDGAEL